MGFARTYGLAGTGLLLATVTTLSIAQGAAPSRSDNLQKLLAESTDPVVMRLLGKGDDLGKALGLDKEWLLRALGSVGNYGEMFERHLGEKTPVGLKRGANNLWTQGGLLYALPLR